MSEFDDSFEDNLGEDNEFEPDTTVQAQDHNDDEGGNTEGVDGEKKFVRNENPITGDVLSKLDIQALREASTLTFVYDTNGDAKIIARKEKDDPTYGKAVLERTIDQVSGVIKIYDPAADEPKSAAVIVDCGTEVAWGTIADSLREDDQVALVFHMGVPNSVLNNAGIYRDSFCLEVQRWDGRGRGALRTFEYRVSDVFGDDNSNRMFSWE